VIINKRHNPYQKLSIMVMFLNIIFLVIILRLSFEKRVTAYFFNRHWPELIVIQHTLFWIGFILVNIFLYCQLFGITYGLYRLLFMLLVNIPLYYVCYGKLVPAYYQTKKYPTYLRYTVVLFVVSCLIRILVEPELSDFSEQGITKESFLLLVYITQLAIILVASLMGISKYKLIAERELNKLAILKKEADLELIKSKINPHFLLNTLNNIYAQSYATDSVAANLIMQLSLLLQYTTYEIAKKRISIEKEIQLINALLSLYQLKYAQLLNIRFSYTKNEMMELIEIPPTIFFTLFENALKYAAMGVDEEACISAIFTLSAEEIKFSISNSISSQILTQTNPDYKGIGTNVLQEMMELEYPDAYQYVINQSSTTYQTILTIDLRTGSERKND
jgi:two-component system LytT family sensor kinase